MKSTFTIVVTVVVLAILGFYMFTYQVRYDQVAVKTHFDQADDRSVDGEPGIKFKMPWPIDKVQHYETHLKVIDDQIDQVLTNDGKSVLVKLYLTWRIENPLKFFKQLNSINDANTQLKQRMRSIGPIISGDALGPDGENSKYPGYAFHELVNRDPSKVRLQEIEELATAMLNEQVEASDFGIKVETVGIRRILLPGEVAQKVFETMKKTQERKAASAIEEGNARSAMITSEAASIRDRILALAERRAAEIRARGIDEAAESFKVFDDNSSFAIFLQEIKALESLAKHATFILDANQLAVLSRFVDDAKGFSSETTASRADDRSEPLASSPTDDR